VGHFPQFDEGEILLQVNSPLADQIQDFRKWYLPKFFSLNFLSKIEDFERSHLVEIRGVGQEYFMHGNLPHLSYMHFFSLYPKSAQSAFRTFSGTWKWFPRASTQFYNIPVEG